MYSRGLTRYAKDAVKEGVSKCELDAVPKDWLLFWRCIYFSLLHSLSGAMMMQRLSFGQRVLRGHFRVQLLNMTPEATIFELSRAVHLVCTNLRWRLATRGYQVTHKPIDCGGHCDLRGPFGGIVGGNVCGIDGGSGWNRRAGEQGCRGAEQ